MSLSNEVTVPNTPVLPGHGQISPERLSANGEVFLSLNHITLLHGLYDRPNGAASTRAEWMRASYPYLCRVNKYVSRYGLSASTLTLHPCWVTQHRRGRRIQARLTDRGRAIVDGAVPARILGVGVYHGLSSISASFVHDETTPIPPELVREAARYAVDFGMPLLRRESPSPRDLTVYAVTIGLDKPFRLVSREELQQRGPRRLHLSWTRDSIASGSIPTGYSRAFPDDDPQDILCYLQELKAAESDLSLYVEVYRGSRILSHTLREEWLDEEIDLAGTDIPAWELNSLLRDGAASYRAAEAGTPRRVTWRHPDTGRSVGSAFNTKMHDCQLGELTITTPAALSCLQFFWDSHRYGIQIETLYMETDLNYVR
jgi:hypothetical protein